MLSITSIENIINNIKTLTPASVSMKNYINSLNLEEYASLSTIFIIGRSGWERSYYDTNEYCIFVEESEANGIKITQKLLDEQFLSIKTKKEQVELTYSYEISNSPKVNKVYNHDWLGMKTNLIIEVEKGLNMLKEIKL